MAAWTSSDVRLGELRRRWEAAPTSHLFLQLAEEYRRRGEFDNALEVLGKGMPSNPSVAAEVALGRCLLESGDVEGAKPHLERAVQRDPTQIVAYRHLIDTHLALGEGEDASRCLEIYRQLNAHDVDLMVLSEKVEKLLASAEEPPLATVAADVPEADDGEADELPGSEADDATDPDSAGAESVEDGAADEEESEDPVDPVAEAAEPEQAEEESFVPPRQPSSSFADLWQAEHGESEPEQEGDEQADAGGSEEEESAGEESEGEASAGAVAEGREQQGEETQAADIEPGPPDQTESQASETGSAESQTAAAEDRAADEGEPDANVQADSEPRDETSEDGQPEVPAPLAAMESIASATAEHSASGPGAKLGGPLFDLEPLDAPGFNLRTLPLRPLRRPAGFASMPRMQPPGARAAEHGFIDGSDSGAEYDVVDSPERGPEGSTDDQPVPSGVVAGAEPTDAEAADAVTGTLGKIYLQQGHVEDAERIYSQIEAEPTPPSADAPEAVPVESESSAPATAAAESPRSALPLASFVPLRQLQAEQSLLGRRLLLVEGYLEKLTEAKRRVP